MSSASLILTDGGLAIAAITCVLATLAVFIIEPGPHVDFFP